MKTKNINVDLEEYLGLKQDAAKNGGLVGTGKPTREPGWKLLNPTPSPLPADPFYISLFFIKNNNRHQLCSGTHCRLMKTTPDIGGDRLLNATGTCVQWELLNEFVCHWIPELV